MYKGSNREYLMNNTNLYDLLIKLNDRLGIYCLLDIVDEHEHECSGSCESCIEDWLNEPHKGGSKNA